jgi:hypothetical protein
MDLSLQAFAMEWDCASDSSGNAVRPVTVWDNPVKPVDSYLDSRSFSRASSDQTIPSLSSSFGEYDTALTGVEMHANVFCPSRHSVTDLSSIATREREVRSTCTNSQQKSLLQTGARLLPRSSTVSVVSASKHTHQICRGEECRSQGM